MIPDGKSKSSAYEMLEIPVSGTYLVNLIDRIADDISPMDIGVIICDNLDVVHYANQAFEYIYGYAVNEAIGKKIDVIFPPGEVPNKLYGTFNGNYDTVTRTGIRLKTIISSSVLNGGKKIIFFRDATKRQQAEGELARVEVKNRALIDVIPDLMFIVKKDGTFLDYKVEDLSQLTVPPEQLIGKKAEEVLPASIARRFIETVDMAIETGQTQYFDYEINLNDRINFYEARCVALSSDEALIIARDFTERKHFEESLKLAQFVMDKTTDMTIWASLDGHITYVNESACKTLGYSREELLSMSVTNICDLVNERNVTEYLEHIKSLKWNEGHHFEINAKRKDCTWIPIELTANYLDYAGKEYICVFARDITERKHAEEARSLLAFIVESSDDAIIGESLDCVITSWNHGAERLYGYTMEEAVGRSVSLILPADRASDSYDIIEKIKRGEKIQHYETERLTKTGCVITVSMSISPILDSAGAIIGASAFVRDITESKKAEQALLNKNQELATLNAKLRELSRAVEQSSSTVVITDINGNIQYVNPKFVALTGYTIEEAMGMNPRILKSGETLPEVYSKLWETILAGKEWHGEFHNKKKNGELYWEQASISPITDNNGIITNFIAVKEDITERKQAEEVIRIKNRDLGILNSIAATINGTADLKSKLSLVLKDVLLLTEMDAGAIYLNDPDAPGEMGLMSFEYRTLAGKNVVCHPRMTGGVPAEIVCCQLTPGSVTPVLGCCDEHHRKIKTLDIFENAEALIAVPLQIKNKRVGIMALNGSKCVGHNNRSELTNIGAQVSIAIENHDLFKSVHATSKYLANVINEAPDAMLTVDRNGKILSFNRNAKRLLKYNVKEIKGKKLSSLLPKGDIDLAAFKSSIMDFRSKDGATVQLNVSISRINKSDADSDYIITLKDLSEISGLKITPITEKAMDTAQIYTMESGTIYMYDRNDKRDYMDIFADQVRHNVQGLCITRHPPVKIRQRLGLDKTPIIWLNASDNISNENCIKPENLSSLGATLSKFLNEADKGFILIDGIEYLIARNGYETVLKFIHFLNDKAMVSNSSILVVLDPLSIDEQQYHMLISDITPFKK